MNNAKIYSSKEGYALASFLVGLFVIPFIIHGINYVDDIDRSQTGNLGWSYLGRPLSELLYVLFSFGKYQSVDISPLPQILSIAIIAFSCLLISKKLFTKLSIFSIILPIAAICNPLFIQNIIYKYDSIQMSLSVLLCITAWYVFERGALWAAASIAMITSSLCFYQTSGPIFPILVLTGIITKGYSDFCPKTILKGIVITVLSYAIYFLISPLFLTSNRSQMVPINKDGVNELLLNTLSYFNMINDSVLGYGVWILSILMIASTIICIHFSIKSFKVQQSLLGKILSLTVALFPLASLIIAIATVIILKNSQIVPRIATPIGAVYILMFSCIFSTLKSRKYTFVLYLFYACGTLSSFAVAASVNDQFINDFQKTAAIYNSINSNELTRNAKTTVIGLFPESLVSQTNRKAYPIVGRIINRGYDYSTSSYLTRLGLSNVNFSFDRKNTENEFLKACSKSKPVISGGYYNIFNFNKQNYVYLGNNPETCK